MSSNLVPTAFGPSIESLSRSGTPIRRRRMASLWARSLHSVSVLGAWPAARPVRHSGLRSWYRSKWLAWSAPHAGAGGRCGRSSAKVIWPLRQLDATASNCGPKLRVGRRTMRAPSGQRYPSGASAPDRRRNRA